MGPFLVISVLFLAGSFGVSWWARRQVTRSQAMAQASGLPLSQLKEDAASVAQEMGAGSFRQQVKIRGRIVCDSPLVSELTHTPCVSYRFSVTREYEQVLWEKDASGKSIQRLQRKSEVVASNEAVTSFWLDDGTARVLVHPEHAKIDQIKTHASFQPATTPGISMGVGSFVLNMGAHGGGTLGYRYEEYCLATGLEVTIVAEAGDDGGQLALRRPEERGVPFLVSPRTFAELARSNQTLVAILRGVSIGLAAVAVLIFLLGVVR